MVVFNLNTDTSELQIAAQLYEAISQDVCARVSTANFTHEESEQISDGDVIAASVDEINAIVFKVAQMLLIQSGSGYISTGGGEDI